MERVLDLTLKLADEGLSPEEQSELERLIESEPLARRRHLQMLEVEAALRSARHAHGADKLLTAPSPSLEEERRVAAVLQAIRRPALLSFGRGHKARTVAVLAAGVLAAAAAVLLIARPGQHRPDGRRSSAGVMARTTTRPPGRHEQIGGRRGWSVAVLPVEAAPPADHVNLDLGDSATLEVRGRAVLGIERAAMADDGVGSRVTLEEGTVAFQRAPGNAAQTAFSTPHAEVVVRSGRALVRVSAEQTRVDVVDGEAQVALRTEARPTVVSARHTATVAGGRTSVTPLGSALLVTGREPGRVPSRLVDQLIWRRLETDGLGVDVIDERELRAEHLQNRSLLVISPTVSGAMNGKVQELALASARVPILCSRPSLYADLGMTGPGKSNAEFSNMKKYVTIAEPDHPLAAGFEGEVEVLDANMSLGWGVPGPGASRVAFIRRTRDHATVFAYERDAPLLPPATRAPARRVGFFLHPTAIHFSNERAWHLFDAAVKWATEE